MRQHRFEVTSSVGATQVTEFTTRHRYAFSTELDRLFRECGFDVEIAISSYNGEPADNTAEQLLYLLRRAK